MLRLTNIEESRCRNWCAVVVLFAAISLTVSVATRYGFTRAASNNVSTSVQKHLSPDPGRQRLLKNAATWMPPVVSATVLLAPASYPRIAPAGPPIPSLFFEKNLYNRPPPYLNPSFS
jgi:hypothetical protein